MALKLKMRSKYMLRVLDATRAGLFLERKKRGFEPRRRVPARSAGAHAHAIGLDGRLRDRGSSIQRSAALWTDHATAAPTIATGSGSS